MNKKNKPCFGKWGCKGLSYEAAMTRRGPKEEASRAKSTMYKNNMTTSMLFFLQWLAWGTEDHLPRNLFVFICVSACVDLYMRVPWSLSSRQL